MSSVRLSATDTLIIVSKVIAETALGTRAIDVEFTYSYDEIIEKLRPKGLKRVSTRNKQLGRVTTDN